MQSQAAAEVAGAVCGCARSAALETEVAELRRLLAAMERELATEREKGVDRAASRLALEALAAAYRKELAAKDAEIQRKDAQLKELRREQFGSLSEVVGAGRIRAVAGRGRRGGCAAAGREGRG